MNPVAVVINNHNRQSAGGLSSCASQDLVLGSPLHLPVSNGLVYWKLSFHFLWLQLSDGENPSCNLLAALLKTSGEENIYQIPNHQGRDCGKPNRRLGQQRGDQYGSERRKYPHRSFLDRSHTAKDLFISQTPGCFSLLTSNPISPGSVPVNMPVMWTPMAQQGQGGDKNRDTGVQGPHCEGHKMFI